MDITSIIIGPLIVSIAGPIMMKAIENYNNSRYEDEKIKNVIFFIKNRIVEAEGRITDMFSENILKEIDTDIHNIYSNLECKNWKDAQEIINFKRKNGKACEEDIYLYMYNKLFQYKFKKYNIKNGNEWKDSFGNITSEEYVNYICSELSLEYLSLKILQASEKYNRKEFSIRILNKIIDNFLKHGSYIKVHPIGMLAGKKITQERHIFLIQEIDDILSDTYDSSLYNGVHGNALYNIICLTKLIHKYYKAKYKAGDSLIYNKYKQLNIFKENFTKCIKENK